jgi:hypothetical protein
MSKVKFRWRVKCEEEFYMAADKQHAHELIDRLSPNQVPAAIGMLRAYLIPYLGRSPLLPSTMNPRAGTSARRSPNRKLGSSSAAGMESHTKRFSPILASLRTISRISKRRREDEENLLV